MDAVDIDGGAMDGTAIGANTASTGAFTNVTASGTLSVTGATTLSNLSGTGSISGFDANLNRSNGAYTLNSTDNGKVVTINSSSDVTLTIDLAWDLDSIVLLFKKEQDK